MPRKTQKFAPCEISHYMVGVIPCQIIDFFDPRHEQLLFCLASLCRPQLTRFVLPPKMACSDNPIGKVAQLQLADQPITLFFQH